MVCLVAMEAPHGGRCLAKKKWLGLWPSHGLIRDYCISLNRQQQVYAVAFSLRRSIPATPVMPVPKSSKDEGSGTVLTLMVLFAVPEPAISMTYSTVSEYGPLPTLKGELWT